MRTCELQDAVQAEGVRRCGINKPGGSLQIRGHLILYLELGHASSCLEMVEVNQLIRLSLRLSLLLAPNLK